jgi:hypothetical protein
MCNQPDFEREEQELDHRLVSLFRRWKECAEFWERTEDAPGADLFKLFLVDVCDRGREMLHESLMNPARWRVLKC